MKFILAFLMFGFFTSALAETKRDLVTRITTIKCTGDKNIEMIWDSAIAPLGPIKYEINGEATQTILRMSFEKSRSSYEWDGFKIAIDESDNKSKTFLKIATMNGKDINLNCKLDETYKFLRKRDLSPSVPNAKSPAASTSPAVKANN